MDEQNQTPEKQNRTKNILMVVIVIIMAFIVYSLVSNISCNSVSSKIEVLTEPTMSASYLYKEYTPVVKAQVKNKSNRTIKVQLSCSIYDSDGSVTCNITSLIVDLAAGESTWLTANTSLSYSLYQYSTKCASFGNVEYKLY